MRDLLESMKTEVSLIDNNGFTALTAAVNGKYLARGSVGVTNHRTRMLLRQKINLKLRPVRHRSGLTKMKHFFIPKSPLLLP